MFYYREKKSTSTMQQLHVEVNSYTLRLLEATPPANMSDVTDLVESFYSFNGQVVKKIPEAYQNPGIDSTKLLTYGMVFGFMKTLQHTA